MNAKRHKNKKNLGRKRYLKNEEEINEKNLFQENKDVSNENCNDNENINENVKKCPGGEVCESNQGINTSRDKSINSKGKYKIKMAQNENNILEENYNQNDNLTNNTDEFSTIVIESIKINSKEDIHYKNNNEKEDDNFIEIDQIKNEEEKSEIKKEEEDDDK